MFKGLIGKKVGMTQIFDEDGNAVPITLIEAGPCFVTQVRRVESDGYSAVQLGFEKVEDRKLSGGEKGHLKKNDIPNVRYLREFRAKTIDVNEGDVVDVSQFGLGSHVDVVGYSKGRGFAGAVKRYGFGGGPVTHGQSDRLRAPGSHGSGTTPGRVFKGARGPGHYGNHRVTSQHVEVVFVDVEKNLLGINGSVPGPKGGLVVIKEARKQ